MRLWTLAGLVVFWVPPTTISPNNGTDFEGIKDFTCGIRRLCGRGLWQGWQSEVSAEKVVVGHDMWGRLSIVVMWSCRRRSRETVFGFLSQKYSSVHRIYTWDIQAKLSTNSSFQNKYSQWVSVIMLLQRKMGNYLVFFSKLLWIYGYPWLSEATVKKTKSNWYITKKYCNEGTATYNDVEKFFKWSNKEPMLTTC